MASVGGKYQEILESLHRDFTTGKYAAGDRLPSEYALARQFGVSRPTAGRALRELDAAGLVERRPGSGTYVRGTRPTAQFVSGDTYGLLAHGLGGTEIMAPICTEIARVCQDTGSTVLWGSGVAQADGDQVREMSALCDYYIERKVQGVFFASLAYVPDREAENHRIATALQEAGIAVILLDRDVVKFPGRGPFDIIGIDNFEAGFTLGMHLADDGYRRYTFVARPHYPATTDLRAAGVREALHRRRIGVSEDWVRVGEPTDDEFIADVIKTDRPDVIICSNDFTAALLIRTLNVLGVTIPQDVAVVGFDDVRYSTLLPVSLTTVRQPCVGIARAAARAMRLRLDDPGAEPHQVLLDAKLIIRHSCGPH